MTDLQGTQTPLVNRRLVLASKSPRRVELLAKAGFQFVIDPSDVDEDDVPPGLSSTQLAQLLATRKARAVAGRHPSCIVIGADTVVFACGQFLAKPIDADDARRMMRLLSDSTHEVVTGVALVVQQGPPIEVSPIELIRSDTTLIRFREISDDEIESHIQSGNWQGKAGGYGLQHEDPQDRDPYVIDIQGDATNVVGLPMPLLLTMLAEITRQTSGPGIA